MTQVSAFDLRDILVASDHYEKDTFEANLRIVKAHTISIDVANSCEVTGRPGYKWVREYGMNGGVYMIPGQRAPNIPNMPVLMAYNPKAPWKRTILDVDWSSLLDMPDYAGQVYYGNHASDHEWPDYAPGFDAVSIYPRALVPLRVYPGTSGLTIAIAPYRYVKDREYEEYQGDTDISLASYQPASGSAVRLLVYLDKTENTYKILAGSQVLDIPTLEPQPPTFPLDATYSALIRLDGDQTTIQESDILDIRSVVGSENISTPATAVGQILISLDGVSFEAGIPLTDKNGDIITDENGYIMVI